MPAKAGAPFVGQLIHWINCKSSEPFVVLVWSHSPTLRSPSLFGKFQWNFFSSQAPFSRGRATLYRLQLLPLKGSRGKENEFVFLREGQVGIKLFEICLSRGVDRFQLVDQTVLKGRDGLVDAIDTHIFPAC